MHCNKVSFLDCFDNDLGNNLADNLEHNAEKLQEILNRILNPIQLAADSSTAGPCFQKFPLLIG